MGIQTGATTLKKDTDVWVLKYYPLLGVEPVFLLWYTDTDEASTDKLLTYKTGRIFAANSLNDLKNIIVRNFNEINEFENLNNWLNDYDNQNNAEVIIYDINKIYSAIKVRNFEIEILEGLTNFINLLGDYAYQDDSNKYLKPLVDNKYIRKAWDYYYNSIFWPRFNDKDRFEVWKRPPFKVDVVKLLEALGELIRCFEEHMVIVR